MTACREENPEVVKMLLEKGADINARSENHGVTALMEACRQRNIETAKLLLESGADPNIEDKQGYTILGLTRDENIRKLLKQHGARGVVPIADVCLTPCCPCIPFLSIPR
jgi:ankyrin repeat protein